MEIVYVLKGRIYWSEGVFDEKGNYFIETPISSVYKNFTSALKKLKELALEAYEYLKQGAGVVVSDDFIKKTTEYDLFTNYNMEDNDNLIPLDVCWTYSEQYEDFAHWQMYVKNIPDGVNTPILAGLQICKTYIQD